MDYGTITITAGNLRNNHLYLTDVWHLIPKDAVGGGNESESAPRTVEVHYGGVKPIITDVAGDKKIFRKRTWVRDFFRIHRISVGSQIIVEKTAPYCFRIYPAP